MTPEETEQSEQENKYSAKLDIIRENIRQIRESKNMSRKELDIALKLEPGASSKLERGGTKDISMLRLIELSEILEVDVKDLLNNVYEPKPDAVSEAAQPLYSLLNDIIAVSEKNILDGMRKIMREYLQNGSIKPGDTDQDKQP